jgi:TPR repeat protein
MHGLVHNQYGVPLPADIDVAIKYFEEAAKKGNKEAMYNLGALFLSDFEFAALESEANDSLSTESLSSKSRSNLRPKESSRRRDFVKAFQYLQAASQRGHLLAMHKLGLMHAEGLGTAKNCKVAVSYLKLVAERGKWSLPCILKMELFSIFILVTTLQDFLGS